MKLTKRIAMTGLCIAVAAWGGVAMADINITGFGNTQIQTPVYDLDDSPSGKKVHFGLNQGGDQSSLGTCTMSPMSSNPIEVIIDEMPVKETDVNIAVQNYEHGLTQRTATNLPVSNVDTSQDRWPDNVLPNDPGTDPDPGPSSSTPEPATMLIFGLGLAGAIPFARRFRNKQQS